MPVVHVQTESEKALAKERLIRVDLEAIGVGEQVSSLKHLTVKSSSSTLKKLVSYVTRLMMDNKMSMVPLVVSIFMVLLSKFLFILKPILYKHSVDAIMQATAATAMKNSFMQASLVREAFLFMIGYGVLRLAGSLAHEMRNVVIARHAQTIGRLISKSAFEHIVSLETDFHSKGRSGSTVQVVDRGTRSFMVICRSIFLSFIPTLIELGLVCAILFFQFNALFSILTLATFGLYVLFTLRMNNSLGSVRKIMNLVDIEASGRLTDSFFNVETLKLFGNEKFEAERYDSCLKESQYWAIRNEKLFALLNFGQGSIFSFGLTIMLVIALQRIGQATLTVGDLLMIASLLEQLWIPLNFLGWQYRELKQALLDTENLFTLLDRPSKISDAPGAKQLVVRGGEIVFDNVSFSYELSEKEMEAAAALSNNSNGSVLVASGAQANGNGANRHTLHGVSFTVPPGKTVAIVGKSGSGKSTTLKLLQRMYDVDSGSIRIDGHDVTNVTLESLRSSIGIIPQDTALFNDTILYNIAYGNPTATEQEIVDAAKKAKIHRTIMAMPKGYYTRVGDKGVRLSGGERQRISIARCILKNPRILLCDEATSSLDTNTEREIAQSLRELQANRSCVIIAHRLSTIEHADKIVVIQKGKVVEEGAHAELLAKNGVYKQMVEAQSTKMNNNGGNDSIVVTGFESAKASISGTEPASTLAPRKPKPLHTSGPKDNTSERNEAQRENMGFGDDVNNNGSISNARATVFPQQQTTANTNAPMQSSAGTTGFSDSRYTNSVDDCEDTANSTNAGASSSTGPRATILPQSSTTSNTNSPVQTSGTTTGFSDSRFINDYDGAENSGSQQGNGGSNTSGSATNGPSASMQTMGPSTLSAGVGLTYANSSAAPPGTGGSGSGYMGYTSTEVLIMDDSAPGESSSPIAL